MACAGFCSDEEFLCGEGRCIPKVSTCDGTPDCSRGEDEEGCTCRAADFQCQFGGGCVDEVLRCDGNLDCADRSDELGCQRSTQPGCGQWELSSELTNQLAGGVAEEVPAHHQFFSSNLTSFYPRWELSGRPWLCCSM